MQTIITETDKLFRDSLDLFINNYKNKNELNNLRDLWKVLYENSFISLNNSFLKDIILIETICKHEPGIGLFLLTQFACIEIIKKNFGSININLTEKYLTKLISGEYIGCFSLTEKEAGSDVTLLKTSAKKDGENWIINGHKIWASNGSIADFIITFAQTKSFGDKNGITCFLVNSNLKEIKILKDTPKLGVKITPSNEIIIKDLSIADSYRIGDIGNGIKIALNAISLGRTYCAAQAIGLLDGIISESVKHSTKRNQFGKSISEYQAIQWYLADMIKDLDASRLLLYKTTWAKDNATSQYNKLSSMSKYFCTMAAHRHSSNAVQILGGHGLNENSYVAKAFRDSKVLEIYEGTNEIQRIVIAKELKLT